MSKTTRTVLTIVGLAFMGLGFLTILSIGLFLFLLGIAIVLFAGPGSDAYRWSVLAGVVGFDLGWLLLGPMTCSATSAMDPSTGEEVSTFACRGVFFTWDHQPGLWVNLVAGLAVAAIAVLVTLAISRKRDHAQQATA